MNLSATPAPRLGTKCPKCANTQGIKDGGPTFHGHREYDILSDTYGVCRCPHCGFRGHYAEFHKPANGAVR